jgi:hypothetical protein
MGSMRPGRAVEVQTHLLVGSVSCAASCVTRLARGRVSRQGRVVSGECGGRCCTVWNCENSENADTENREHRHRDTDTAMEDALG